MHRTRLAALACSVALTALAGCDPNAGTTNTEARAAINTSENEHARPHGHHHPLPVVVAHLALDIDLQAGQAAEIEDALEALRASHEAARVADQALRQAATDGVAEGLVSRERLAGPLEAAFTAAATAGEAETTALDALHTILSEEQRLEVVDAFAEHHEARREDGRRPPPPGPAAHLRHMAEAIGLSDEQIIALHDALGGREPPAKPPKRDGRILAEFGSEDFDAASLGMAERRIEHTAERAEGFIALLAALSDVVDDDQREALVTFLAQPPPGPHGGSRDGGPEGRGPSGGPHAG